MSKEVISTTNAPAAIGPYSQAIKAGGFLFISGQIPLDPATGTVVPGCVGCQAEQSLKNLTREPGAHDRRRRQDDGLHQGHERLRDGQRGLREVLRRKRPRALLRRGRPPSEGRARRSRGHSGLQVNLRIKDNEKRTRSCVRFFVPFIRFCAHAYKTEAPRRTFFRFESRAPALPSIFRLPCATPRV